MSDFLNSSAEASRNPLSYGSLGDYIEKKCAEFSTRTAFINFGTHLTYRELEEKSAAFAAFLQQNLGLQKGARVAVMMPNLLQYPIAIFGILRAGLVVVNVNPRYTADELKHQLKDAGAQAIVLLNIAHSTLKQVLSEVPIQHIITTKLGDLLHFPRSWLLNLYLRSVKHKETAPLAGAIEFEEVLEQGKKHSFTAPVIQLDDLAFLQYTGGTTGVAKGAMLSHRNILANVQQMCLIFKSHMKTEECVATVLPLYHIFALTVNCMTFFALGFPNILVTDPTKIRSLIHELEHYPVTIFLALNTLFNALNRHPAFRKLDFSKWHLCVAGGMATHRTVAEEWQKITGIPVVEGYGLTEASPVVSVNPLDAKAFNGTVGLALPHTELSIRDEAGNALAPTEIGEVWVRGPQVMQGYWQQPLETANVLTQDGWLKTGDLAYLDAQQFLHLVDRKKEMIIVSGFNVYPSEIERVIAAYPGIKEVAVIGRSDEETGERIKAFIVPTDKKALDLEALRAYCHEHLTSYKIPRIFELSDSLPKSAVGKVLKRALN